MDRVPSATAPPAHGRDWPPPGNGPSRSAPAPGPGAAARARRRALVLRVEYEGMVQNARLRLVKLREICVYVRIWGTCLRFARPQL